MESRNIIYYQKPKSSQMKNFDQKQFIELSKIEGDSVVSLYLPVSRISTNGYQEDRTNLKNLIAKVQKRLTENSSLDSGEVDKLLAPAKALLADYDFWKYNSDMLVCILHDGKIDLFNLPYDLDTNVCFIGKKPYLMPMISALNDDGHYYLLLLDLDQIRLYEATRNTIQEIHLDPEEVAISFVKEEEEDENQKSIQGQGNVGNARAMFHGHGEGSSEEKKYPY